VAFAEREPELYAERVHWLDAGSVVPK
jgi:hypothetical protein